MGRVIDFDTEAGDIDWDDADWDRIAAGGTHILELLQRHVNGDRGDDWEGWPEEEEHKESRGFVTSRYRLSNGLVVQIDTFLPNSPEAQKANPRLVKKYPRGFTRILIDPNNYDTGEGGDEHTEAIRKSWERLDKLASASPT